MGQLVVSMADGFGSSRTMSPVIVSTGIDFLFFGTLKPSLSLTNAVKIWLGCVHLRRAIDYFSNEIFCIQSPANQPSREIAQPVKRLIASRSWASEIPSIP